MNIKTKLLLGIGMLAGMIILLVTLSVVNLQILTATEPDSPAAMPGLERALLWVSVTEEFAPDGLFLLLLASSLHQSAYKRT